MLYEYSTGISELGFPGETQETDAAVHEPNTEMTTFSTADGYWRDEII